MKKLLLVLLAMVMSTMVFMGCSSDGISEKSSDDIQAEKAERSAKQATIAVGEPRITNWNEKNQIKEIYEKRDDAELICHAYIKNINGKFVYLGISKGFGVNASIQFSNPVKLGKVDGGEYGALNPYLMPQAEPNGLFMPEGLSATYLNLLNEDTGEFYLAYIEENVNVFEQKLPKRLCDESSLPENY